MVIGIFGESCTGKSTLADRLKDVLQAQVYTGKDYLRLAKNESIAKRLFRQKLEESVTGDHVVYVIPEIEHLTLLPAQTVRVLVTADIQTIKERFAQRMGGILPTPLATMLEKKHGCFDTQAHTLHVVSNVTDLDEVCNYVRKLAAAEL